MSENNVAVLNNLASLAHQLDDAPEKEGDSFLVHCVAHEDTHRSLLLSEGATGKTIVYCRAGCTQTKVISELRDRGLWRATPRPVVASVLYHYIDEYGREFMTKRKTPKTTVGGKNKYAIGKMDDEKFKASGKPDGTPPLYGLVSLLEGQDGGEPEFVCVVEGEKDVDTIVGRGGVAVCNYDGAGKWSDEYTNVLRGHRVLIIPDNDRAGRDHANMVGKKLDEAGIDVKVWYIDDIAEKGDVTDWFEDHSGTWEKLRESYRLCSPFDASDDGSPWTDRMLVTERGGFERVLYNVKLMLENSPKTKGVLRYNEFQQRSEVANSVPWRRADHDLAITDYDTLEMTSYMNEGGLMVSKSMVDQGAEVISKKRDNRYDPLKDYLLGLKWDGVGRVDTWLKEIGATSDEEYCKRVGAVWLIAGVARGLNSEGVKADQMLILEGDQGIRKSTCAKALCPVDEWFTDSVNTFEDNDTILKMQGKWIIEIPELAAFSKNQINQQKAFLSRTHDTMRLAYARFDSTFPRRCIFIGSHNPEGDGGYLNDSSGSRRVLPVSMGGDINIEWLEKNRNQLWAEACVRYKSGEKWWFDPSDAINQQVLDEQTARYKEHEIMEEVRHFLTHRPVNIGGVIEWTERDEPDLVFFPKVFWESMYGEDYATKCPKHTKDGMARGMRIRKWNRGKFYCKVTKTTKSGWRETDDSGGFENVKGEVSNKPTANASEKEGKNPHSAFSENRGEVGLSTANASGDGGRGSTPHPKVEVRSEKSEENGEVVEPVMAGSVEVPHLSHPTTTKSIFDR
jgi:predicted P-loop ATPase